MSPNESPEFHRDRLTMVKGQIEARGVQNAGVLEAMRTVPRHRFVSPEFLKRAYEDTPLPIGYGQTISQPYIVARMSELLQLPARSTEQPVRVLEIGTGCGYQTAVLARLADAVFSIEIVEELAARAQQRFAGVDSVQIRQGDGYGGWPDAAPFQGILVAAAPPEIPPPLLEQLAIGGRLVIPVGEERQELLVIRRTDSGWERQKILPVRFVPMVGRSSSPRKQ